MRIHGLVVGLLTLSLLVPSVLADRKKQVKRVQNATEVFSEVMDIPEKAIPKQAAPKAVPTRIRFERAPQRSAIRLITATIAALRPVETV